MASNGVTTAGAIPSNASPAEQLRAKHAEKVVDTSHRVQIEDVEDEEDKAHPPQSTPHRLTPLAGVETLSDIAKGKQKAVDPQDQGEPRMTRKDAGFNVNSEEAFPALGASKSVSANVSNAWSKRPTVVANGNDRPVNGSAATNKAGRVGPPSARAPAANPQIVSLPGRHVERIAFAPHQITPRKDLKKSIPQVLKDINQRSKAKVTSHAGPGGGVVFEGQGPVEAVRLALKEVANQIGSKQSIKLPIPASVRPYIIGRQGATIQNIHRRTGARIQVPKQEDTTDGAHGDDDTTVDIIVEGDAVAAEMARREIEAIVNERTSNVNMHLKDIPAEFYPFLTGSRNTEMQALLNGQDVSVQIPHYHTWQDAAPPPTPPPPSQPTARAQPSVFIPQPSLPIRISGDRAAAQAAKRQIERQVEAMRRQLIAHQISMERGRHQFIIGEGGCALHDFLAETGCSVVVPPTSDDSENLFVIGPPDRIEKGVNKVLDLATSMAVNNVDVARQHAKAPDGHAHNLTRYLRERQAIAAVERQYGANIMLPATRNSPATWQIYSRDAKEGMRARTDIMNLIAAHPPSRLHCMDVNPFFHDHIRRQTSEVVRRTHGVHILFPSDDDESHELVLIYEAPGSPSGYEFPRQRPTPAEIMEHEKAIQESRRYLSTLIGNREIVMRQIEAAQKFHDKIRRYADREQRGLPEDQIPVQLLFGDRPGLQRPPSGSFAIRGPQLDVDSLNARILDFIEQEKKDEVERGFTMSFEFPHKFASFLIGKRGDNIKKLHEEFDVEINYQEGKVELKGPKAKAEACKTHIMALAKKLEDETTHVIKVKPQYHGDLKGSKGSQLLRLQERYGVRINFPRNTPAPADDADAATEGSAKNFRSQAPDEVLIKGSKKGADEAREELLNLLQWTIDHSHSASVSVAQKQVPMLIGTGGRELDSLRLATGCHIDMPKRDANDASSRVDIKLRGTRTQVEAAKKLLEERARAFDDNISTSIDIERKHHKALIGAGGANLQKIILAAGGPEDRRLMNRMVVFPKQDAEGNTIRLEGQKAVVDRISASIQQYVAERDGQVTETMEVVPEKHRLLIGAGGNIRRKIENDFKVEVDIPKQSITGPERSMVKVTGRPEDIAKAKVHIEGLLKEQASDTIDVPRRYHHLVSDEGNIFRRLRNDHGVTVDHAGQKPPPRPAVAAAGNPRAKVNGGALPLITDDASIASNVHSWEIVDHSGANGEDASVTIPWVLRGNKDNLAKARLMIENSLKNASKPSSTGYLILPDSRLYRFVIGPNGSTINSIRDQTGAQITVPRAGTGGGEAIEVKGTKEGVEQAKDLILEAVKNGGGASGGGGRRRS